MNELEELKNEIIDYSSLGNQQVENTIAAYLPHLENAFKSCLYLLCKLLKIKGSEVYIDDDAAGNIFTVQDVLNYIEDIKK